MAGFHLSLLAAWCSPVDMCHTFFSHSPLMDTLIIYCDNLSWLVLQSTWGSCWPTELISSGYKSNSGIAELYYFPIFNWLRNLHSIFHKGYINLCYHHESIKIPFSVSWPALVIFCLSHWFWFAFLWWLGELN